MSQRLRVVGWLRFGNKAQLTKGLEGFAANEAPGYFESDHWEITGLDARVRIDSELPGDFDNVERGFMAMFGAAKHGYVDYFEDGNTRIYGGHKGPFKRWARAFANKWVFPEGTMGLGLPAPDATLVLGGSVQFADEKAAKAAKDQLPFRLPYLDTKEAKELRLGDDVFRVEGKTLALAAVVTGPANVLEDAIAEALMAAAAKAKAGAFTVHPPRGRIDIKAGGKRTFDAVREAAPPSDPFPRIAPVDPKSPLPEKPEDPKAKKKASAEAPQLEGHAKVVGAKRFPSGHLAVWGGNELTIFSSALAPLHTFSLAREEDAYGWPIEDVLELGAGRFAIHYESWSRIDLLDLAARTKETIVTSHSGVKGAAALGGKIVSWSYSGKVLVHDGLEQKVEIQTADSLDRVVILPDGTGIAIVSMGAATRWNLETGAKIADLEKCTAVHVLSNGTFLLEDYGKFSGDIRFTVDEGNSHTVIEVDETTLAIFSSSQRKLTLVDRASGKKREIATGHKKDLGGLVRLSDDLWVTHGKSMPGLNERFGFDAVLMFWTRDWEKLSELDIRAPVRAIVPFGAGKCAVLFDGPVAGKEMHILDGRKPLAVIKAKKAIAGAVSSDDKLLYWSKDFIARVFS
jgi:hypothetical protein